MLTRCPKCATTFRITPEQLKVRLGRVRCGHCQSVFSALDTLIEEPPQVFAAEPGEMPAAAPSGEGGLAAQAEFTAPLGLPIASDAPPLAPVTETESKAEIPAPGAPDPLFATRPDPVASFEAAIAQFQSASTRPAINDANFGASPSLNTPPSPPVMQDLAQDEDKLGPATIEEPLLTELPDHSQVSPELPAPEAVPLPPLADLQAPAEILVESAATTQPEITVAPPAEQDAPLTTPLPSPATEPAPVAPKPIRRWPWWLASGLATVLLLGQLSLAFRVELAARYPALRPALLALGEPFAYEIPLPSQIDLLSIDTSDLNPGEHKGQLVLSALLRNRARYAQSYPILELTLNDVTDQPLLVRAFKPEEYLPRPIPSESGFAANSELPLHLEMEIGDLPAAGYRLYIYYP